MAGNGRPKWMPDEVTLKKIEQLAAQGLTVAQVARSVGIGPTVFFERQKEMPELKEAMENGRAKGIATITNTLFQKAKTGDNTAMIFYLKNRDPENWSDKPAPAEKADDTPNRLEIEVVYPNADKD